MANNLLVSFDDLAESKTLAVFADIFRELTGIAVGLVDPCGTRMKHLFLAEVETPICRLLHSTASGIKACKATDRRKIKSVAKQRRPIYYPCHAGLLDIAIPIIIAGRHIATILCGQLLPQKPSRRQAARHIKYLMQFGLRPEAIRNAYFKSPFLTPARFLAAVRLLTLFANYCCETAQQFKFVAPDGDWRIQRAKQYGLAHYNDQIRLKDAAAQAGYAPAHFSAVFKRQTGYTWCSFLQTVRIHEVIRCLEQSHQSVTEIAYACGFSTLTHFNRVFRSLVHCSPTQYRRKDARPDLSRNAASFNVRKTLCRSAVTRRPPYPRDR